MNLIDLIEFTLQGMKLVQESISQVEPRSANEGTFRVLASVRARPS